MKKSIKCCMIILLMGCFLLLTVSSDAQHDKKSPSIIGTYTYVLDEQEGMCIITKTHAIWLLADKGRKSFQSDQPTETEKSAAFTSASADGGTYKFVGPSRVEVHRLFSTNPALVGKDLIFEYEFDGDICKYWVLQADGSRGPIGRSKRVEK